MGTRSTIKFYDEQGDCVASIYQQYDGYPSNVGLKLAQFLSRKSLINGISGQTMEYVANGIGCLAAQFIAEIKTKIGNVYMTSESDTEEYDYVVKNTDNGLEVSVDDFKGTVSEFLEFCEKDE